MSLERRRQDLTLKYYYKIKSQLDNPAFQIVVNVADQLLFHNKRITPTLAIRAKELVQTFYLPTGNICPAFSYTLLNIQKPSWDLKSPTINEKLNTCQKKNTTDVIHKQNFHRIVSEQHRQYKHYYTDRSKTKDGVGAAVGSGSQNRKKALPRNASIFTAELHALRLALESIKETEDERAVILTDSMSAVKSLQNRYTNHLLSRKLQYKIDEIAPSRIIAVCWVPSYVGIKGNERVEDVAKAVAEEREEPGQIFYKDYFGEIRKRVHDSWTEEWRRKQGHLRTITDTPGLLEQPSGNIKDQVIIDRLRLGHSQLSHGHLMNSEVQEPPRECPACTNDRLAIKHIMVECPMLQVARRRCISAYRTVRNLDMKMILGNDGNANEISELMRTIGGYNQLGEKRYAETSGRQRKKELGKIEC